MSNFNRRHLLSMGAAALAGFAVAQCGPQAESQSRNGTPRQTATRTPLTGPERDLVQLFERTAPSVVQVVVIAGSLGAMREVGGGTGFFWDSEGHVVTNNHVVENAPRLGVRFAGQLDLTPAQLVGRTANYDLAVLVQERRALPPPIAIARSDEVRVGQNAYAIGNPFGLDQSLTQGVVSALNRTLPTRNGRELSGLIQTDAPINPGNSGGPLLDSAGRVIGVNTAIFSPSGASAGIGFAIPIDTVNRVVPQIIATGRAATPGIGIAAAREEVVAQLGLTGVLVMQVAPGGPADRAGIEPTDYRTGEIGDLITAANGEPVRQLIELVRVLERAGVGATVTLRIERNRQARNVQVQVVDIGD
jgi:2-alkenal reductase